jgi:hypothetical protein
MAYKQSGDEVNSVGTTKRDRPAMKFEAAQSFFSPTMVFRESYQVPQKHMEKFIEYYQHEYSPELTQLGLRNVGFWVAYSVQGTDGRCLAMWEADSGPHMTRVMVALDSMNGGVEALQRARDELSLLADEREGWVLLGLPGTLSLAEMNDYGIQRDLCLFESVDILPNMYDLLNKAIHTSYVRMLKGSGIELLGIYRPQVLTTSAVIVWSLTDGLEVLSRLDEIENSPEFHHWNNSALSVRTSWRGELYRSIVQSGELS